MICGGARWCDTPATKLANVAFSLHYMTSWHPREGSAAAPGLAATRLQATTDADGGMGSGTWFMRWSQSPEDGAVPLLHCCLSSEPKSGSSGSQKG